MNAREMYDAIRRNRRDDQQQVLFELLSLLQTVSTAVIEIAGAEQQRTGTDPLAYQRRVLLSEFLELKGRTSK